MSVRRYTKGLQTAVATAVMALTLNSCIMEEDLSDSLTGSPEDNITVQADVAAHGMTRAYVASGVLDAGEYNLVYNRFNYSSYYDVAKVEFGHPEGPTTGYAFTMNGDQRKDLKWRDVYGGGTSTATFYMHNIPKETYYNRGNATSYWHNLLFNQSYNPYVASPLDKINGTNDILSGSTSGYNKTGKLNFNLYHRLSLLKIVIEVYGAKTDDHLVNLENAELYITNVGRTVNRFDLQSPTSFSYNTSMSTGTNSSSIPRNSSTFTDIGTLTMVEPESQTITWDGDPITGSITDIDGNEFTKMTYSTKEFVVPPQSLPPTTILNSQTLTRPILTVRVPKKDVTGAEGDKGFVEYSGMIPDIMFNADEDGNITSMTPQTIAFLSGYQTTITASINSPETQLNFTPVKVEGWISKSSFTLNTKEAGIYNAKDFAALVEAYNNGQTWMLERYGYQDSDGTYLFQLWANITLDKEAIKDCMKPKAGETSIPFGFVFNEYSVTFSEGGSEEILSGNRGQFELYNWVTGSNLQFYGIRNRTDLMNLVALFNNGGGQDINAMLQYGTVNNITNTLTFDIEGSFDVDIADVFQTIPAKYNAYTVNMSMAKGYTMNIVVSEAENLKMTCTADGGFSPLNKMLYQTTTPGFSTANEFYLMTDCYNKYFKYYNDILKAFGTVSTTGTWTLYIRAAMTLEGSKTYLSMIPDTENDKPNYSISGSYKVTITDDKLPSSTTSYFSYMLKGNGAFTSTTSMRTVVDYYNNTSYNLINYENLWRFGKFENGKWRFSVTNSNSQYVPYTTIFGKMIPDEIAGKYDFEFYLGSYLIEVRTMPNTQGSSSTSTHKFYQNQTGVSFPNSAADLKRLALGTYWDYFDTWTP